MFIRMKLVASSKVEPHGTKVVHIQKRPGENYLSRINRNILKFAVKYLSRIKVKPFPRNTARKSLKPREVRTTLDMDNPDGIEVNLPQKKRGAKSLKPKRETFAPERQKTTSFFRGTPSQTLQSLKRQKTRTSFRRSQA